MQNDHLIARMQSLLLSFEGLFFEFFGAAPDLARLHTESEKYDARYESLARRREIDDIILLDEILYVRHLSMLESASLINDLKNVLFSPDFYRDMIFGKPLSDLEPYFTRICENVTGNIDILDSMVSDEDYKTVIKNFSSSAPPSTRREFLVRLGEVEKFLESKNAIFA